MYPLNHQDPIRVTARGSLEGIDGDPTPSLDRHRTASYRLSCISEHQKENTRSSEDEYFPSPAQAIKTPSLEPVRWPHRRHHGNGKSQSSGDGSAVSPLQLDPEQIEGFRTRETHYRHHLVLSTWRCAAPASVQSESQLLQEQEYEALRTQQPVRAPVSAPGLASPGIFEVQWQMIRWSDFQPRHLYVNGNERATSSMGLDGPQSSTSGNSPLHSPIDVSSPPLASLPLSNCLPCIPRRLQLDTPGSIDWENSWPKRKPRKRHDVSESSDLDPSASKPVDSPPNDARSSMTASLQREEAEDQAKFRNTQENALKSCPELYRRFSPFHASLVVDMTELIFLKPDKVSGLKSPNYSRFDSGRHQHRHHIHETVSKRFHSFRDRLRRGRSSSMFSVRPEFPPPRPGRSAKSSLELARISSGTSSARSASGSSDADKIPVVPASSPALLLPPAGLANPISRLPRGAGRLSRRQHSRLSEVTTPEEINNPSQDAFPGFEAEPCESSMPQPLSSRRLASSDDALSNVAPLLGLAPEVTQSPLDGSGALDVTVRSGIGLPGWPSPSGRNLEPLCGQTNTSDEGYADKNNLDPRLSTLRSPAIHTRSEPNYQLPPEIGMETVDIVAHESALLADVMEQLKFTESQAGLREFEPRPCHPNTWSPDQGEPGDSEPFCPPNCLYAARCGHESEP
ncbi:hypothetical protein EKO27_g10778 [Xylaria grammica]|uniref:Uncharacterized protein n=1 Tax=Xylaria grammica TaxID=363999 RepID=A0A439CQ88_9PEZI|nr:hypothetical protein EKO27_g10778 [Xylaria grammica]